MAHSVYSKFPESVKAKLVSQINADPGIPKGNPTLPTWQIPVHPLSDVQSEVLPSFTDFAIIGSGITGCSVAKHILEHDLAHDKKVTVLDARTLTSGATSRNAGFMLSHVPSHFGEFTQGFGKEGAEAIAKFCKRTLEKLSALITEQGTDVEKACEKRAVEAVIAFTDEELLKECIPSIKLYEESFPDERGVIKVIGQAETEQIHNLKGAKGALCIPAHVFWPYRLITRVFESLLQTHKDRFSIETKTAVTSITYSPESDRRYPYVLVTSRGSIRASKIFHCTNGFSGHLLPGLRGKIYPLRLTMSSQGRGREFPNLGAKNCWMFYSMPEYDDESGILTSGMYYMQQNAKTGDLFFGGEKQLLEEKVTSDDTTVSAVSIKNVSSILPTLFLKGWDDPKTGTAHDPEIHRIWSGIAAATPDQLPLVGQVPVSVTGRVVEGGEWIAAGYNGYGMTQCWSAGEAIATMALGEPVPEWLPEMYLATEERLKDDGRMGSEAAIHAVA